jgi:hypothetical protein
VRCVIYSLKGKAMNAKTRIILNKLVNSLIEVGIIKNVVEAPVPLSSECVWEEFDRVSQANMLASAIHTAYAAVVNAAWREEMGDVPIFDSNDDYPYQEEYAGAEPRQVQTLAEAIDAASVVRTMVRSYASDNRWLNGWTTLEIVRDANGRPVIGEDGRIKKETRVVRSFSCDIDQFFEVDASTDQAWKDKLDVLRLKDIHIPYFREGIDAVKSEFLTWLDFVPWSQEEDPRSRLERIVQKAGDKKWEALKVKVMGNLPLDINDLRHWVLIAYSPKFQEDAEEVRKSDEYNDWLFDQELEAEEIERKAAEIMARKAKLDAIRQMRMNALLTNGPTDPVQQPVLTPEVPPNETKRNGGIRITNNSGIPSYSHR